MNFLFLFYLFFIFIFVEKFSYFIIFERSEKNMQNSKFVVSKIVNWFNLIMIFFASKWKKY